MSKPTLVPCEGPVPPPPDPPSVAGFERTLDRRGARALVRHKQGWAGHFLLEVTDDGATRVLAKVMGSTSARWLDDERVVVSEGDALWIGRDGARGLVPVSAVEGPGGAVTPLSNDMIAVDAAKGGWLLFAVRGGMLRAIKGAVKPPAGSAKDDLALVTHDGRVFAVAPGAAGAFELSGWDVAGDVDLEATWSKELKKAIKGSSLPCVAATPPTLPAQPPGGVTHADGSRWRLDGDGVAVEHDGNWRTVALAGPLAGRHLADLPPRERDFLVGRLVHGAVDTKRGVGWLMTGGGELLRIDLATGSAQVHAALSEYASVATRGVFPLDDGRVVVVGASEMVTVGATAGAAPRVDHVGGKQPVVWGCCAARQLAADLIAHVTVRASATKNGVPSCLLQLVQIAAHPRTWLSWQLPMYAPGLHVEGATLIVADEQRGVAIDLGRGLEWYRDQWSSGRDDVPALPA